MKLNEMFDSKVDVNSHFQDDYYEATFVIGDYHYYFSATLFDADDSLPERWDIEFGQLQGSRGRHDTTNTGMPLQVFAGVRAAFMQFYNKYNPTVVCMSGENSRIPLYTKIISNLLPSWQVKSTGTVIIATRN